MSNNTLQQILKNVSDQKLIKKAYTFAEEAHRGQKRASGEDYIIHPLRTALILSEMKLDPPTVAAGLLHDVLDDTKRTVDDLEKEFGKEISFLVQGVSKLGKLRYPKQELEIKSIDERVKNPLDVRAENLRKMFFAMGEDLRVVLIKLADRLHNMETLGSLGPERQQRIALETLEIFAPLADRLGIGEIRVKLKDLAFPYLYPREYEWLMKNVKEKYEARQKYLETVTPIIKEYLKKEKIKVLDIHSRAKSYWSLYQKLLHNEMNFDKIHDLVALRIIVKDVSSCYKALGIIHKHWRPLPEKIKDFIALPKPNGYRGLHTTCFCIDGKITEIQIKTPEMHREAESGICAHWAYKEKVDLAKETNKFSWVKQLEDWQKEASQPKEFIEGLKIDFFKNRIFVFTPKGDVIDLPEGATAIYFAYNVHTEIGSHCAGAKANGKIIPLSEPLKNGDVVEVIVDKNRKPARDWLEFVKTSFAKSHIKAWIKQEEELRSLSQIKKIGKEIKSSTIPLKTAAQPLSEEKLPTTTPRGIFLAGEKGLQVYLAKCCSPQPGDSITAYITKTKGASIHRPDCLNVILAQKKWPQKIVEATWANESKKKKQKSNLGLLGKILNR
jgi:GTP pyrophosphokinase